MKVNKFLIMFLMVFLLMPAFTNSVFAGEFDAKYEKALDYYNNNLSNTYSDYLILNSADTNSEAFLVAWNSNGFSPYMLSTSSMQLYPNDQNYFQGWVSSSDAIPVSGGTASYAYAGFGYDISIHSSTQNIYANSNLIDVFFSPPIVKTPTLPILIQSTPMMVLGQVVGLLPLLIVCLVGFVALRKALQILFQILYRA